jgi:hypothetical protein
MEALQAASGQVTLSMSVAEAIVLYELIAFAEWAEDLTVMELARPQDQKVMSDVQQALAPLVPDLGTDGYSAAVQRAYRELDGQV